MRGVGLTAGLLLAGCGGEGSWALSVRSERASVGLSTAEFEDGCAVVFDTFVLNIEEADLVDEDGVSAGGIGLPSRVDLVDAEVVEVATIPVAAGRSASVSLQLGGGGIPALSTTGYVSCRSGTVAFDWAFDERRKLSCPADELDIPDKGEGSTQLEAPVETLFVDGTNPNSQQLLGEPFVEADANHDGELGMAELDAAIAGEFPLGDLMRVRVDGLVRSEGGVVCARAGG